MGTVEFNELFADYPASDHVDQLRSNLYLQLNGILPQLEMASVGLTRATLDNRRPVQDAVSLLDDVMTLGYGLPNVSQKLEELRAPAMAAIESYNAAAQERRGLTRRRGQVTQQEFDDCTGAVNRALCDIAVWVQTVMPDA